MKSKRQRVGLLILLAAAISFSAGVICADTLKEKREDLYSRFGPKLLEAVVRTVRDEINLLRVEAGLAERTNEQIVDSIKANLDQIEDYDWQKNQGPPEQ